MTTQDRFGRREVLVGIGAATLGAAIGLPHLANADRTIAGQAPVAPPGTVPLVPAAPGDPARLPFGSLTDGSAISTHWRIESVNAIRGGAIPVVMSTIYGGRFAVEIFRADADGPSPIGRARGLALHLVNEGDGASRTNELQGLGVMALGRALDEQLAAGASLPGGLETYRDRMAQAPNGAFAIRLG